MRCAPAARVAVSARNADKAAQLAAVHGDRVCVMASNQEIVDRCRVVVLAVRPQVSDTMENDKKKKKKKKKKK